MEKNEKKEIEIIEEIPVYLERTEDGWLISDLHGYEYSPEEMLCIAEDLRNMAIKHREAIEDRRMAHEIDMSNLWHNIYYGHRQNEILSGGYVYMFECVGNYKIGYTKDMERRFNELNKKPFQLHVFAVSPKIPNAFQMEQELHSQLEEFRSHGEWYTFTDKQALKVKRAIENLGKSKDNTNG